MLHLDTNDFDMMAHNFTAESAYTGVTSTGASSLADMSHVYVMDGDQRDVRSPQHQNHHLWTRANQRNNFAANGINMDYFATLKRIGDYAPLLCTTHHTTQDAFLPSSRTPVTLINTGPRDLRTGRKYTVTPPLTNYSDACTYSGVHVLQTHDYEEFSSDLVWLMHELRSTVIDMDSFVTDEAVKRGPALRALRARRLFKNLQGNRLWEELVAAVEARMSTDNRMTVADQIAAVTLTRWAPFLGSSGRLRAVLPSTYVKRFLPTLAMVATLANRVAAIPVNDVRKAAFNDEIAGLAAMTGEEAKAADVADAGPVREYEQMMNTMSSAYAELLAIADKVRLDEVPVHGTVDTITQATAPPGAEMKVKLSPIGL